MTSIIQDTRYAIRSLRRAPAYTTVAILTIALGVGLNTGMFTVTRAVLLQPLPYPDADRMVALTMASPPRGLTGLFISFTRLSFLESSSHTVDGFAAFLPSSVTLQTGGDPELMPSAIVNQAFFDVLGIRISRGRGFRPEDDRPGGPDVALISDVLWRTHFGARMDVIGRVVDIDGRAVAIEGILPADFRYPFVQPEPQIWRPRVFETPRFPADRIRSGAAYLSVIARARGGETSEDVRAELAALSTRYNETFPGNADSDRFVLEQTPLRESLVGAIRRPLLIVLGATALVFFMGCVNLTSLVLARASGIQHEMAVRSSLGASRARLLQPLLIESTLLSVVGGFFALLLAIQLPVLLHLLPPGVIPEADRIRFDNPALILAMVACALTAIVLGVVPARRLTRDSLPEALSGASRGARDGPRVVRTRACLVVTEIAVAATLAVTAGLFVRSLGRLTAVDPGFEPRSVMSFTVTLPPARYPEPTSQSRFFRRFLDALNARPEVLSAGANSYLPLSGGTRLVYLCPEGTACRGIGQDPVAALRQVTPKYFDTMRIRLLRGRVFDSHDDGASQDVCVINEKAANDFFPNEDPLGRTIVQSRDHMTFRVVGTVGNVKSVGLDGQQFDEYYVPQEQSGVPIPSMAVVVRPQTTTAPAVAAARSELAMLDRDVALADLRPMAEILSDSVAQPRLIAAVVGTFATLSLALAAIGVYGMLAHDVAQRRREIALRRAIGAQQGDIAALIFRRASRLVVLGLTMGVAASLALTRALRALLFHTSPYDPAIFVAVAGLLVVVSCAASYVPTRRAVRVDPAAGMRGDF